MGKYSNAVFPKVRVGTCYLPQDILILGHSRRSMCSFDQLTFFRVIRDHMKSNSFFPLTFDRIEAEHRKWSQFVYLAKTHRLICNMTRLFQHVISRDLDLRSNSDIESLRSTCRYTFRRLSKRGTRCYLYYVTNFPSPKLQAKTFFVESAILTYLGLYRPTR